MHAAARVTAEAAGRHILVSSRWRLYEVKGGIPADRGDPGDPERAGSLVDEAIEDYRDMGMPEHVRMSEENR